MTIFFDLEKKQGLGCFLSCKMSRDFFLFFFVGGQVLGQVGGEKTPLENLSVTCIGCPERSTFLVFFGLSLTFIVKTCILSLKLTYNNP